MLFCIRLDTFAVPGGRPGGRPGLALPLLPPAEADDPALLYGPARFGEN